MAQSDGHLTFDTKINVDGFNEGTEKIVNSLSKIGEQLKKLAESAVSVGNDFTTSLKKMKDSSKEASEQSEKLAKNTKEYKEAVKDAGEETQKTAKSMSLLDFAGVQVFSNLATQAITKLGSKLKNLATSVLSTGIGFESSMSEVAAISGATDEELEKLTATAKEYGAATKFTAEESAQAFKYMALAGWDATQMTEALPGVLNLAASAGMDLAQASDIVTDYISAFGMETKEATYLADLLSYAQSNSNTSVEQLSEAYKNCAASMHSTGQSVETTTALLSSMANQGFKGAEAGTALTATMRDITDKMYKVTDETIKANEELKGTDEYISNLRDSYGKYVVDIGNAAVAVSDEAGNYKQLIDIMKDVEKVTGSMTEAERASELQSTFTRYSIKGVNMILTEGADSAAAFATELENSAGTAAKAAETMQDNVQGDLTKLSSAFDGLKLSVFEELKEPIRDVLQTLTKTLSDSKTKEAAVTLGKSLGNMAKTLASKLPSAIDAVSKIVKFLWDNKGLIAGFTTTAVSLKALSTGTKIIKTIGTTMKDVGSLNLWGWVSTGISLFAGLSTAAKTHFDDVKKQASKIPDEVENAMEKTKTNLENFDLSMKENQTELFNIDAETEQLEELKHRLEGLVNEDGTIKDGCSEIVDDILTQINEHAGTSYGVLDGVITKNGDVITNLQETSKELDNIIKKQHAEAILEAFKDDYIEALKNRKEEIDGLAVKFQQLDIAEQKLAEAKEKQKNAGYYTDSGLAGFITNIINHGEIDSEVEGYQQQVDGLNKSISESAELIPKLGTFCELFERAQKSSEKGDYSGIEKLVGLMGNLDVTAETASNVGQLVEQYVEAIERCNEIKKRYNNGDNVFGLTAEDIKTEEENVRAAFNELINGIGIIGEGEDNPGTLIARKLGEAMTAQTGVEAPKTAENFFTCFKESSMSQDDKFAAIAAYIREQLDDGESYSEIGKNMGFCLLNGLDIGLWKYAPIVTQTASDVMSGVINAMNWMAEIHSPSRVMMKSGKYLDEGLEIGIEKNAPSVINTSTEMMNSILNTAKKLSNKDFLSNQGLNSNVNTLQSSESVPEIFTNNFISRFRAIQQIPTEQIQRLVNATNNMANMQGLNSVAPYSSVYNNVYNNHSETNVNKSQSITNKSSNEVPPISLYATFELDGEQFGTAVLNEITRANASTGGYSV